MHTSRRIVCLGVFSLAYLPFGEAALGQATFTPLGDLPGGLFFSRATAISGDGSTVVGQSHSANGYEAFRWMSSGGMAGLGVLLGPIFYSSAEDVSDDGTVVVGTTQNWPGLNLCEAFRWTVSGGMVGLDDLPGGLEMSEGLGVSADGSVVVGNSTIENGYDAFRWTASTGLVGLMSPDSSANAVSGDGSVVVGFYTSPNGDEAFRWTASSGITGLGDLPGGPFLSTANDISGDGFVIVGQGSNATNVEAFRWAAHTGMVGLGDLPGGRGMSNALGVSLDGLVIVGQGTSVTGALEGFYWTELFGMLNMKALLFSQGASNVAGWSHLVPVAVSGDGFTIAGYGTNPNGQMEAWVATLPVGFVPASDYGTSQSCNPVVPQCPTPSCRKTISRPLTYFAARRQFLPACFRRAAARRCRR